MLNTEIAYGGLLVDLKIAARQLEDDAYNDVIGAIVVEYG